MDVKRRKIRSLGKTPPASSAEREMISGIPQERRILFIAVSARGLKKMRKLETGKRQSDEGRAARPSKEGCAFNGPRDGEEKVDRKGRGRGLFVPSGPDASVDAPLLQDDRGPLLDRQEGFVFFSERTRFGQMALPGFQGKGLLKFQREMAGIRFQNCRYTWHGNSPNFFADRALSKSLETFPCRAPGIPSIGPDAICPWVAPSRA